MSEEDSIFDKLMDRIIYVLIIVAVITGVADYFRDSLGTWFRQNWIGVTVAVGVSFLVWFLVLILQVFLEGSSEYGKKVKLKKSIIRKRILKERLKELEGLDLTTEEKELQISEWVEKAYHNEILGISTSASTESKIEPDVEKVPSLSQREKEIMINKVSTRCCYPNCRESISLEVHHIIPRSEGGTNKENNLIVLCNNHHHLADRGAISRDRLKMYSVAKMKDEF